MSIYGSAAARSAVMDLYQTILDGWPIPHRELDVPTRWGSVHVIAAGGTRTSR